MIIALSAAVLLGFAGSLHCLAMCGPLMMGMQGKSFSRVALYQSGRLFSYVLIGGIFGIFGELLSMVVYQQTLSIVAGGLVIVLFLPQIGQKFNWNWRILKQWTKLSSSVMNVIVRRKTRWTPLYLGILNGFLPCGLVYFAATSSIALGNFQHSVIFMLAFGLGTLPAISALFIFGSIKCFKAIQVKSYLPLISLCLGLLLIIRGLSLGIPYLSPQVENCNTHHFPVVCGSIIEKN